MNIPRIILVTVISLISGCGGSGSGSSGEVTSPTPTPPAPTNSIVTGTVTITGDNSLGSVLSITENLSDGNGLGTFSYQWLRDGQPIENATQDQYVITSEDLGTSISVTISFVDGDGFNESVSSTSFVIPNPTAVTDKPNILIILSDDMGLDASNQYSLSADTPNTPALDNLAQQGIVFDSAWVTPACTTTRSMILTGLYGVNSGVTTVPAELDIANLILPEHIKQHDSSYSTGAFGKWHLGGGNSRATHPNESGFDYYAGNLSNIPDYYDWELTINGDQSTSTEYHTTHVTQLAIDWINDQDNSWFAWLAYSAPHTPLHLPPAELHNRDSLTGTNDDIDTRPREYFLASIEAMDSEIGRLFSSIDPDVLSNTIVIFLGDNGSPRNVIDTSAFPQSHSKGTLYEGGIRVPFTISGAMIENRGSREDNLISGTDLFNTISELLGIESVNESNGTSFKSLLDGTAADDTVIRSHIYSEFESDNVTGWTVSDGQLKLIEFQDGTQELYDLTNSITEMDDVSQDPDYQVDISRLRNIGLTIRGQATTDAIDISNQIFVNRNRNCKKYVENYASDVLDVNRAMMFNGELTIEVIDDKCLFQTNAIPNHDFNDGAQAFPNQVSEQDIQYEVTTRPVLAADTTPLSLGTDNALLLNGVKVDVLAAACFGVGDERTGCGDDNQPWRFDPIFPANGFRMDSHNAHTQPDGTYHYHGVPNAFYHEHNTDRASPVVGFAADGFPIYGPNFSDNGVIRKATSSYVLKSGDRPTGDGNPGGSYDGTFRDDYEYVPGAGDLDECNGMMLNGEYGYYITDEFPYIIGCFKGTPDASFNK